MVILLNKRDIVESGEQLEDLRDRIHDRMMYVGYAPVISISALTGKGVLRIWDAIDKAYDAFSRQVSTSKLNAWLEGVREFGHTVRKGKAVLKLKYMTQTHICRPSSRCSATSPTWCAKMITTSASSRTASAIRSISRVRPFVGSSRRRTSGT